MSKRAIRKVRHESNQKKDYTNICRNCGDKGSHFAPPSMGEEGFFVCASNEGEKE